MGPTSLMGIVLRQQESLYMATPILAQVTLLPFSHLAMFLNLRSLAVWATYFYVRRPFMYVAKKLLYLKNRQF